ncbi:MAG: helix-turn-helix domain-containing protein [Bacteroidales bacterium]|nr:helix-turn-helix domain-containing protein [Bacteroidales bacterium]
MDRNVSNLVIDPSGITSEDFFTCDALTINRSLTFPLDGSFREMHPYRTSGERMILVKKGSATYQVNLESYPVGVDDVLIIPSGSIVELTRWSEDLMLHLVYTVRGSFERPVQVALDAEKQEFLFLLDLLWMTSRHTPPRTDNLEYLALALKAQIKSLYEKQQTSSQPSRSSRQRKVFLRFKELVREHCTKEHRIPFYAGQLNVSPHYLSALVKAESGSSVMDWIEKALIQEAKVLLSQTEGTVIQISEELGFPNPAFFNKYFKRLTGITPLAYRKACQTGVA